MLAPWADLRATRYGVPSHLGPFDVAFRRHVEKARVSAKFPEPAVGLPASCSVVSFPVNGSAFEFVTDARDDCDETE